MAFFQYAFRWFGIETGMDDRVIEPLEARDRELEIYVSDAPWHYVGTTNEPPFQSGFANFSATFAQMRFRMETGQKIALEGFVKTGTPAIPTNPPVTVFTLPPGFWPSTGIEFPQLAIDSVNGRTIGYAYIDPANGNVQVGYWLTMASYNSASSFGVNGRFGLG